VFEERAHVPMMYPINLSILASDLNCSLCMCFTAAIIMMLLGVSVSVISISIVFYTVVDGRVIYLCVYVGSM